jgi:hypothetical protein
MWRIREVRPLYCLQNSQSATTLDSTTTDDSRLRRLPQLRTRILDVNALSGERKRRRRNYLLIR